jgi:hypothetical protein
MRAQTKQLILKVIDSDHEMSSEQKGIAKSLLEDGVDLLTRFAQINESLQRIAAALERLREGRE